MKWIKKIDGLVVFFVLSIVLLMAIDRIWRPEDISVYRLGLEIDHQLHVFSDEQGNVLVETYNPELEIRYSLDGGENYFVSDKQLNLSQIDNPYLLDQPTSLRWMPPFPGLPEIKSVRVLVVDHARKLKSEERVVTDLNGFQSSLPLVSINVRQDQLVGWKDGIMVLGKSATQDKEYHDAWWYRNANFQERGMDWEVSVNVQYIEDNELLFDEDGGMRISGNATRGFAQKSLRIYARKMYDKEYFDTPFWEEGTEQVTSLVLRNSGNDNFNTMFADILMHRLARESELLIQEGQAANVFINGNYWGILNIRERIDQNFVAQKRGWKWEEVTLLEDGSGELKAGLQEEKERYDNFIQVLKEESLSPKKEKELIEGTVNINSFFDYIFFETYYANNDWPHNNVIWYCKTGKKFKWMLNDLDYSLSYPGQSNINANIFEKLETGSTYVSVLFNAVMRHEKLKKKFKKRAEEHLDTNLSEESINKEFSTCHDALKNDIHLQWKRWRNWKSVEEWDAYCQNNLDFLINRRNVYKEQLSAL